MFDLVQVYVPIQSSGRPIEHFLADDQFIHLSRHLSHHNGHVDVSIKLTKWQRRQSFKTKKASGRTDLKLCSPMDSLKVTFSLAKTEGQESGDVNSQKNFFTLARVLLARALKNLIFCMHLTSAR